MFWTDDCKRGPFGLGVSIREMDEDFFRLFFDRLEKSEGDGLRSWDHMDFVTTKKISRKNIEESTVSEEQMLDIGRVVVAIIGSQFNLWENKKRLDGNTA